MDKKLLIIAISSILTFGLLVFFIVVSWDYFVGGEFDPCDLNKDGKVDKKEKRLCEQQPQPTGKCGDGICDDIEKSNPDLCPEDCDGDIKFTPVYFTIYSHNERTLHRFEQMRENINEYKKFRDSLIRVAEMINDYGFKYSWQTDYVFLEGIQNFEETILEENPNKTKGKPLLRYLKEDLSVSIEAHAHECWDPEDYPLGESCVEEDKPYNYADLAYLIKIVAGFEPPLVMGGTKPPDEGISYFSDCVQGNIYDYEWCPEILTLFGYKSGHGAGSDDFTSGIWKPKELNREDFYIHNPSSKIIYIGTGNHAKDIPPGVKMERRKYLDLLIEKIESGEVPQGKIYTMSMSWTEDEMINQNQYDKFEDSLKYFKTFKDQGKIIPVTYPEAVEIWKTQYSSEPNIYTIDNFKDFKGYQTEEEPPIQGGCGDGVCQGPETSQNCPEDCE